MQVLIRVNQQNPPDIACSLDCAAQHAKELLTPGRPHTNVELYLPGGPTMLLRVAESRKTCVHCGNKLTQIAAQQNRS